MARFGSHVIATDTCPATNAAAAEAVVERRDCLEAEIFGAVLQNLVDGAGRAVHPPGRPAAIASALSSTIRRFTLNGRTDRFDGATLKQRARFAAEVVQSVRQAMGPGFPIILRLS